MHAKEEAKEKTKEYAKEKAGKGIQGETLVTSLTLDFSPFLNSLCKYCSEKWPQAGPA